MLAQIDERNRLYAFSKREALGAAIHRQAALRSYGIAG
jgi:hypothetical protein